MTVTVKLFATLREGRAKILELPWEEGMAPQGIIEKLEISKDDVAILLINGRDGTLETELSHNDTVSIFPPVGGG